MIKLFSVFALLPLLTLASAAAAQNVHRLSDEEIAEIEARPSLSPDQVALLERHGDEEPARRMQSELSIGIGTHGYFDVRASTLIPLGSGGMLALSLQRTEFDNVPLGYILDPGVHY
ncbi:hypothetical protein [Parasphingopyxis marina]|uniref:Uncharacterized protein n=1 Tax=Parasphingopyxis marina TaxID=2761622 RepID=A0A842HZF2_9SPHN|nr:hypothetical protein [Parasphingopyxis marina]MBC2777741.1 hypothetical protein [Parasphingopyxis marina]